MKIKCSAREAIIEMGQHNRLFWFYSGIITAENFVVINKIALVILRYRMYFTRNRKEGKNA